MQESYSNRPRVKVLSGNFLWRDSGKFILDYDGNLLSPISFEFQSIDVKFIKIRFKKTPISNKKTPKFSCSWKMMTQVNCSLN
ncbi:hypothetical protein SAMN05444483_104339 [Salegentibacter echinorum]|uniref:Uncharacterized protein n=1 Tax=Salegentibacter echinorum TaxID=1073325 RepID=A0A1M5GX56_SALEC|nr:hypothetical protein SAMN05444483_104339 [Salegentibacter echinorum]